MSKVIKNSAILSAVIIAILISALHNLSLILRISVVQDLAIEFASHEISKELGSEISLGHINYELPNTIDLQELILKDKNKDSLLYIGSAKLKFDFFELFHKKLIINKLSFNELKGTCIKEADGSKNIDFLIEYLTPKDSIKKESNLEFYFDDLKFSNSSVTYIARDSISENRIRISQMNFKGLNASLGLKILKNDSIEGHIRSFSLFEPKGLKILDLHARLKGKSGNLVISDLFIKLEHSDLQFDSILIGKSHSSFGKDEMTIHAPFHTSKFVLSDLQAFAPNLKRINKPLQVSGIFTGMLSNLKLKDFKLTYGRSVEMDFNLEINGLPKLNETFLYAKVNKIHSDVYDMQDLISKLSGKPFILGPELKSLGEINYRGTVSGLISNMVMYGNLSTHTGSLSTDILLNVDSTFKNLNYQGSLNSSNLALGKLLSSKELGNIAFNINSNGRVSSGKLNGNLRGNVSELKFNGYQYKDIQLSGNFTNKAFDGNIKLNDKNLTADFHGIFDFTNPRVPRFDFDLLVNNMNPHALHILKNYEGSSLSFSMNTNLMGQNLDNIDGSVNITDIHLENNNKQLNAGNLTFISSSEPNATNFSIRSDYLNGTVSGNFKYSQLGELTSQMASKFVPSLLSDKKEYVFHENQVHIDLKLENTSEISDILDLPYKLDGTSTIKAELDQAKNNFQINARLPRLQSKNREFQNITFQLNNKKNKAEITSRMQVKGNAGFTNWYLLAEAAGDSVSADLGWQNNAQLTDAGDIKAVTYLLRDGKDKLGAQVHLKPTQIILSDSVWNVLPSEIIWRADTSVQIKNFGIENARQFIRINGKASGNLSDSIHISMKDLNMEYLFSLIKLKAASIGGDITGEMNLVNLFKEPIILADLSIRKVSLNGAEVGDAKLNTSWNKDKKQIDISGNFTKNQGRDQVSGLEGSYVPANDSLMLHFLPKDFNVAFLNRYFEGVASNFGGSASGDLRLYGPTSNLLFAADLLLKNGRGTVDLLKTSYSFNDSIHLTPYQISLDNIRMMDEEGNPALLKGKIDHNGGFGNMRYNTEVRGDNMLAMNTTSRDDDFFYGKAFLGGIVKIFGDESECHIDVEGITRPGTKCFMSMGTAESVAENNFVRIIPRRYEYFKPTSEEKPALPASESKFNVITDMRIELNSQAEMDIIVDPQAGDEIKGRGRGNLRIQFDTFSDVFMYGTVDIDYGYYLFTMQTLFRKEFKINSGSTIAWAGSAFGAKVNLNGYYPLTASLSDLMDPEELAQVTTRSSVPVNCLLHLTDDLMSPTIKFDIDLPSSDESVKQRVKSIINTDEMMNRQMVYLLLLNKFYTPDYLRSTPLLGVNEGISFATATLSSQFNSWVQHALNSNIVSVGVDWQKSELINDEVKANILIQPNNKLVINGNIGYRNDNINVSTNKFIGDFDLEYKLFDDGKLRFNAYNHTIDRAQLREARTTQGLGLLYREDFANFAEMVTYYWKLITFQKPRKK